MVDLKIVQFATDFDYTTIFFNCSQIYVFKLD